MLLPSAIGCDSSQPTYKTRFQSALFASPPLSPPSSSSSSQPTTLNNIYSTCRALQSMLTTPNQLPSPPTLHSDIPFPLSSPPFKLKLRARKTDNDASSTAVLTPRKKITKRAVAPPRGINKRRRVNDDEMSRASFERDEESSEGEADEEERAQEQDNKYDEEGPRTPKRMRIAPEALPLGLERSDFHSLHLQEVTSKGENILESIEGKEKGDADAWSTEEDRLLVELVLEKLKLSKSEWQDCARSLGKDRGSVGKRWKSLMNGGEVGLKNRSRRSKIHGTWR